MRLVIETEDSYGYSWTLKSVKVKNWDEACTSISRSVTKYSGRAYATRVLEEWERLFPQHEACPESPVYCTGVDYKIALYPPEFDRTSGAS